MPRRSRRAWAPFRHRRIRSDHGRRRHRRVGRARARPRPRPRPRLRRARRPLWGWCTWSRGQTASPWRSAPNPNPSPSPSPSPSPNPKPNPTPNPNPNQASPWRSACTYPTASQAPCPPGPMAGAMRTGPRLVAVGARRLPTRCWEGGRRWELTACALLAHRPPSPNMKS